MSSLLSHISSRSFETPCPSPQRRLHLLKGISISSKAISMLNWGHYLNSLGLESKWWTQLNRNFRGQAGGDQGILQLHFFSLGFLVLFVLIEYDSGLQNGRAFCSKKKEEESDISFFYWGIGHKYSIVYQCSTRLTFFLPWSLEGIPFEIRTITKSRRQLYGLGEANTWNKGIHEQGRGV